MIDSITTSLLAIDITILFWTIVISAIMSIFGGNTNLILQSLAIGGLDRDPGSSNVIELKGRREGLLAFLLTVFGLSPTTSLVVNHREALCTSSGLFGVTSRSLPIDRIPQVTSGSRKPIEFVVVATLVGVIGLFSFLASLVTFRVFDMFGVVLISAIFVGGLLLLYSIKKRFFLGIYAQGGAPILLSFKPNVIEGVPLDLERAMVLASTVRSLVVDAVRPECPAPLSPTANRDTPRPELPGADDAAPELDGPFGTPGFARVASENPQDLLVKAQECIKAGRRDEAIAMLRHVVKTFPTSAEADHARRALAKAGIST